MHAAESLPRPRRLAALLASGGIAVIAIASGVWIWLTRTAEAPLSFVEEPFVTVIAGDGVSAVRDGAAHDARFSDPSGVAVAPDGSIYVADGADAHRIRRIAPDGSVSTVAGGEPGYRDGPAAAARFETPSGVAIDARGALLVADTGNHVIRRISPDGVVTTVAGDRVPGFLDGDAGRARFYGPTGITIDPQGRVIVADTYNDRIRAINPDGTVVTVAGSGRLGWADGPAPAAAFHTPAGIATDADSSIYVADLGNVAVRKISRSGVVETIPHGGLVRPTSIAVDADGAIYVGGDDRLVEVRPGSGARVVAGSAPGFADGSGAAARFRGVAGIALAGRGELITTDRRNALIRRLSFASRRDAMLPAPPLVRPRFNAERFGLLPLLWPFAPQSGPFEITATFGEPRAGVSDRRLHAGIDIAEAEGTRVVALRDGIVASLDALTAFGTIFEAVAIGPITYVHLRVGRDRAGTLVDDPRFVPSWDEAGRLARVRVPRGARFRTGDQVGTLNAYNHAHINVGWPGEEENPLRFTLPYFRDTTPPVIAGIRLLGTDTRPLSRRERGRLVVDGPVEIVVDAWDQVDGNAARRRLGVYSAGFQILEANGAPAPGFTRPRQTLVFDRVPSAEAAALVFAADSGISGQGVRASRFLYRVTNSFRNGVATSGVWEPSSVPPGDYILRIWIADIAGNVATRNRDVPITVGNEDQPAPPAARRIPSVTMPTLITPAPFAASITSTMSP